MSDELWDGVESVDDAGAKGGLSEGDTMMPGAEIDVQAILLRWLRDLTYREVHAIVVGFAPFYLGMVLLALDVPAFLPNSLLTLGVLIGATSSILAPAARASGYVGTAILWMLKEPQYVLGGQVAALLTGGATLIGIRVFAWLLGVVL